ncbi:MAG: membrane protein insertase YidC [Spirochaetales bacterium]|nr:membrane protein insertase YidC [Spirochaetales bacterium]
MEKNTIIAIVLSTLVIFVSMFIQYNYYSPKQQTADENVTEQTVSETGENQAEESDVLENDVLTENSDVEKEPVVEEKEETYVIKTSKAEVTFSNRGGDIVSYKIFQTKSNGEIETIEMSDNISDTNRSFGVAFGSQDQPIRNEIFSVMTSETNPNLKPLQIGFVKDINYNGSKVKLAKLYTFKDDEEVFNLEISVESENGLTSGDYGYTICTPPQIGPEYDKSNRYEIRQYIAFNGSKGFKKTMGDKTYDKEWVWAGAAGKYFTVLVKPADSTKMISQVKTSTSNDNSQVFLSRKAFSDKLISDSYYIYIGPRSEAALNKYNSSEKNSWKLNDTKFNIALQTSGMFSWIEIALRWGLKMLYKVVKNYGVAIIILTLILKLILFPLNKKTAMGSVKMQELQPKMAELQEKYKNDQQKLGLEMQKLYKQIGYNPMSGCLPMIIQMIILWSVYSVFNNTFEFRNEGFIAGWIDDLTVGDKIFTWERKIPLISGFTSNCLRLLPFIYTGSQLLSGIITQYGGSAAGQSNGQMKFMMYGLPIIFFFMFYNVPSGLLLYWTTSNILQIGQQILINNMMKKKKLELSKNQPKINQNELKFKGGKKKTR